MYMKIYDYSMQHKLEWTYKYFNVWMQLLTKECIYLDNTPNLQYIFRVVFLEPNIILNAFKLSLQIIIALCDY